LVIDTLTASGNKDWHVILDLWLKEIGGLKCVGVNFDKSKIPTSLPQFYKNMLSTWALISVLHVKEDDPYTVLRQPLWNNRHILIDISYFWRFIKKGILYVADLWSITQGFSWQVVLDFGLNNGDFLCWASIIHALPNEWKGILKQHNNINLELVPFDKVFLNGTSYNPVKVKSRDLYDMLLVNKAKQPTAQADISRKAMVNDIEWESVYARIYKITIETYLRCFQYKILNNCLYLNKKLYIFKLVDSPRCSYCLNDMETVQHLFVECLYSQNYYLEIRNWLNCWNIKLPSLNCPNIILGIDEGKDVNLVNFIICIYKLTLYKTRPRGTPPNLDDFIYKLKGYKQIEWMIALKNKKVTSHLRKWEKLMVSLS